MERIGIYDARAKLSQLVERVEAGEEVILTRHGEPVARLVREKRRPEGSGAATVKRIRTLSKRLNLTISRAEVRRAIARGRD